METDLGENAVDNSVGQRVVAILDQVILCDREVVIRVQLPELHNQQIQGDA